MKIVKYLCGSYFLALYMILCAYPANAKIENISVFGECPLGLEALLRDRFHEQNINFFDNENSIFQHSRYAMANGHAVVVCGFRKNIFKIPFGTTSAANKNIPFIVLRSAMTEPYIQFTNKFARLWEEGKQFNFFENEFQRGLTRVVDTIDEVVLSLKKIDKSYEEPFKHAEANTISQEELDYISQKQNDFVALSGNCREFSDQEECRVAKRNRPIVSVMGLASGMDDFLAADLGMVIANAGFDFMNGACSNVASVMYKTCMGAKENGSNVFGVISTREIIRFNEDFDVLAGIYDQLYLPNSFDNNVQRINIFNSADIVVVAPGGTGTIDEAIRLLEIRCAFSHQSFPLVIINFNGFFDAFIELLNSYGLAEQFAVVNTFQELKATLEKNLSLLDPKILP